MQKELDKLTAEKTQLESHILRMQTWCENQGKWRAHVYETEVDDLKVLSSFCSFPLLASIPISPYFPWFCCHD